MLTVPYNYYPLPVGPVKSTGCPKLLYLLHSKDEKYIKISPELIWKILAIIHAELLFL